MLILKLKIKVCGNNIHRSCVLGMLVIICITYSKCEYVIIKLNLLGMGLAIYHRSDNMQYFCACV